MTNENKELIPVINQSLELALPETLSLEELKKKLATHINFLINNEFEKLVFYLYRIDVSEAKIKALLHANDGENAASLIAGLIIERQLQKIESRKKFSRDSKIGDDEKW